MLSKSAALDIMEQLAPNKKRVPFQITFCTANRKNWGKYRKLKEDLISAKGAKRKSIINDMASLDIGGKLITHPTCQISAAPMTKSLQSIVNKTRTSPRNRNRKLLFLPGTQIRQIRTGLILKINNQTVTY